MTSYYIVHRIFNLLYFGFSADSNFAEKNCALLTVFDTSYLY